MFLLMLKHDKQHGFGMVEVLITMVITAFALLGLAALQLSALRYQKIAHFRGIATIYSVNIAERVRANIAGAKAGYYSSSIGAYPATFSKVPEGLACADGLCTAAEIAATDIQEWRSGLSQAMTGGWGEISGSMRRGFVIRVYFKEPGKKNNAAGKNQCREGALQGSNSKDVRCFSTVFVP
ncbi:type IV pilus modification protein PilV [Glaciimonas sp. PCH181]|uniref:type IV pilus modification protein PilV n=1 Tax=Glaciimonas sp. PCH181 TaxID=2133943 RepID=UPI000D38BC62|nr:type IV pilus modification protein PilV [Glaciimonas sp. PCH181]PUA17938.1 type IV pilus modification protein PilV [Glaciimonas sp. PCH181]